MGMAVDREYVTTQCASSFNKKLRGMRTYNSAFVVGSKKVQASTYKDHAATDKQCFLEASSSDVTEYAPCKALHNLDVEKKFDIAYLIPVSTLEFSNSCVTLVHKQCVRISSYICVCVDYNSFLQTPASKLNICIHTLPSVKSPSK